MGDLEYHFLNDCSFISLVWYRFIDDTFFREAQERKNERAFRHY